MLQWWWKKEKPRSSTPTREQKRSRSIRQRRFFLEEKGFKELVSPFKEEIERRGWEKLSKHRELGVWALVKEFYTNLGE